MVLWKDFMTTCVHGEAVCSYCISVQELEEKRGLVRIDGVLPPHTNHKQATIHGDGSQTVHATEGEYILHLIQKELATSRNYINHQQQGLKRAEQLVVDYLGSRT